MNTIFSGYFCHPPSLFCLGSRAHPKLGPRGGGLRAGHVIFSLAMGWSADFEPIRGGSRFTKKQHIYLQIKEKHDFGYSVNNHSKDYLIYKEKIRSTCRKLLIPVYK